MQLVLASLLLTVAAAGQIPCMVGNPAPIARRNSWVSFAVPDRNIPLQSSFEPYGWPVFRGPQVGPRTRLVHIRCGWLGPAELRPGWIVGDPVRTGVNGFDAPRGLGHTDPRPTFVVVLEDGSRTEWRPAVFHTVESGPARTVFHAYGRIPRTMFVIHAWFHVYQASRVIPFEIMLANADPTTTELFQSVREIGIESDPKVYVAVDFNTARGGGAPVRRAGRNYFKLHGPTWWVNGQGAAWLGRIVLWENASESEAVFLEAEMDSPVVGMASDWRGRWGPWGVVPPLHPQENTAARLYGWRAYQSLYARFTADSRQPGSLWKSPLYRYGLADYPGQAGDQPDFGVTKCLPALGPLAGNPFRLLEVAPSVLRRAGRASYFYEADGSPLDPAKHPELTTWGYQPHFKSKDRLGKTGSQKWQTNTLFPMDFGHTSSNLLAGWTLLTGSYLGRHLLRHEIGLVTKCVALGEVRAWGRVPLATTWGYLATGDARALAALQRIYAFPIFDGVLEKASKRWEVVLLYANAPDMRDLGGRYWTWQPWQHALAIEGLDAATRLVENRKIDDALFHLCRTLIKWGWWKDTNGRWVVGTVLRYLRGKQEGSPLSPAQYRDRTQALPHYGTAFDWWSCPAVIIARRRFERRGEKKLVTRCDSILAQLQADRAARKLPVGFDRPAEWCAVK